MTFSSSSLRVGIVPGILLWCRLLVRHLRPLLMELLRAVGVGAVAVCCAQRAVAVFVVARTNHGSVGRIGAMSAERAMIAPALSECLDPSYRERVLAVLLALAALYHAACYPSKV